jgi:hypothetical protein
MLLGMNEIEQSISVWLNVATLLVFVGAVVYISLIPYMTRDK